MRKGRGRVWGATMADNGLLNFFCSLIGTQCSLHLFLHVAARSRSDWQGTLAFEWQERCQFPCAEEMIALQSFGKKNTQLDFLDTFIIFKVWVPLKVTPSCEKAAARVVEQSNAASSKSKSRFVKLCSETAQEGLAVATVLAHGAFCNSQWRCLQAWYHPGTRTSRHMTGFAPVLKVRYPTEIETYAGAQLAYLAPRGGSALSLGLWKPSM